MGNADTATKAYTKDNRVFADIFNYFYGRKMVDPDKLSPLDAEEIFLSIKGKRKVRSDNLQKFRDVIKKLTIKEDGNAIYVLLGVESQTLIHYAMPIRVLLYDALRYYEQVRQIVKEHRSGKNEKLSNDEFISGFRKEDKILPIITTVVYFGEKPWDAPRSLKEMYVENEFTSIAQDYRILLLEPFMDEEELDKLESSLREVMLYIRNFSDKEKLKELLDTNDNYTHLDKDAADVILAVTNTQLSIENEVKGGKVNMKNAINEMREESLKIGEERGREAGEKLGIFKSIMNLMDNEGWSFERAISSLRIPEVDIAYYRKLMDSK